MGKNCLLTLVPNEEALPDAEWAAGFNAVAEELVDEYTYDRSLPFSVTDAAANAAAGASDHGYHVRATMVAPHDSMGFAGAASVWYQATVVTRQSSSTLPGPVLAVAFLPPAPIV